MFYLDNTPDLIIRDTKGRRYIQVHHAKAHGRFYEDGKVIIEVGSILEIPRVAIKGKALTHRTTHAYAINKDNVIIEEICMSSITAATAFIDGTNSGNAFLTWYNDNGTVLNLYKNKEAVSKEVANNHMRMECIENTSSELTNNNQKISSLNLLANIIIFMYVTNCYGKPNSSNLNLFLNTFEGDILKGFNISLMSNIELYFEDIAKDAISRHMNIQIDGGWHFFESFNKIAKNIAFKDRQDIKKHIEATVISNDSLNILTKIRDYILEEYYSNMVGAPNDTLSVQIGKYSINLDTNTSKVTYKDVVYENLKEFCSLANIDIQDIINATFMYNGNNFRLKDAYASSNNLKFCDIYSLMKIDSINKVDIVTPVDTADNMIDMLPDWIFNPSSKFLDINCKSARILLSIIDRLMNSKYMMVGELLNKTNRLKHILSNQIFGVASSYTTWAICVRTIYGELLDECNIKLIPSIHDKDRTVLEKYGIVMEAFKGMKFDVVASNPPYNKGADMDFVVLGDKIAEKFSVWITPAKWELALDDSKIASEHSYQYMRDNIRNRISKLVFYPNCAEVFDIQIFGGISYFIVGKEQVDSTVVENRCNNQRLLECIEDRKLLDRDTLHNIGNQLLKYLGDYESFTLSDKGKYGVFTNKQLTHDRGKKGMYQALGIISYTTGKAKVMCSTEVSLTSNQDKSLVCLFASDDVNECDAFKSWVDSKFVRYLVLLNMSIMSGVSNEGFRFVPKYPNLDRVYTNEEIYQIYGLNNEDAVIHTKNLKGEPIDIRFKDIIEAVIK